MAVQNTIKQMRILVSSFFRVIRNQKWNVQTADKNATTEVSIDTSTVGGGPNLA